MKLILASQSPRRKELLSLLQTDFTISPAHCDETIPEQTPATQAAELLAVRKAAMVAQQHPEAVVIGADTTVIVENTILGKPANREECLAMLRLLAGRTHTVCTGVAIFWAGKSISFTERTAVTFFSLTDDEINSYADTDEPYDKAGAYGIQSSGGLFVSEIHGDYNNVVGLPVAKLNRYLKKLGIIG